MATLLRKILADELEAIRNRMKAAVRDEETKLLESQYGERIAHLVERIKGLPDPTPAAPTDTPADPTPETEPAK